MSKTIICYGDSNTHGYRSDNDGRFDEHERWPCVLQTLLGDGYLVREEGLSGRTTVYDDPLFEGLSGLSYLYPCLMTHEPVDLLIIMLGTNDTKARFASSAENIAKGMERLAQKALSTAQAFSGGRPNVLIVAPAPIEPEYRDTFVGGEMGPGCDEKSRMLARFYKEVADRLGCHFFDAGTLGLKNHPRDHMHLDRGSHRLLAEKLAEIVPSTVLPKH